MGRSIKTEKNSENTQQVQNARKFFGSLFMLGDEQDLSSASDLQLLSRGFSPVGQADHTGWYQGPAENYHY